MTRKRLNTSPLDEHRIMTVLRNRTCSSAQILRELGLPRQRRVELTAMLKKLAAKGSIVRLHGGVYAKPEKGRTVSGRFVQTRPGFGFVIPEDGKVPDLYIAERHIKDAMPEDTVEAEILPQTRSRRDEGRKLQARIVRVIARSRSQVVGRYAEADGLRVVYPDGMQELRAFTIARGKTRDARHGEKVVAKVLTWPKDGWSGTAEVLEVLGPADAPGVDITSIVKKYEFPESFSKAALAQAVMIAREPDVEALAGRLDLRDRPIVTIDGVDARDFDDAVSCEDLESGGWRLGVHIADVSHYLEKGTRLDLEARERGTSVYLPDRVLHMLPEALSCGICSLVPDKDRLTVSAFMEITPQGKTVKTSFFRSVIHSAGRLTYDAVEQVLDGRPGRNAAAQFSGELHRLQAVARALRQNREARGSLDFDLPDPKVVMGTDGKVQTIEKRVQLKSHRLIEDCMIAANEAVAEYLRREDVPSLYRIHEPPSGEKLEAFELFLKTFGYRLQVKKPREASLAFQKLLRAWEGKPEALVLNNALLRAMTLAVYASKNAGHFGLGSECYTHFTSPIRRYPDLMVHRALTEKLAKVQLTGKQRNARAAETAQWGDRLSKLERRAEKAEREAVRVKQMAFMTDKLGKAFTGVIGAVTQFGFFVTLDDFFVEGLVRAAEMQDDYYYFDESRQVLHGANHGRQFSAGQALTVVCQRVDWETQQIIFVLEEKTPQRRSGTDRMGHTPRLMKRKGRKRL